MKYLFIVQGDGRGHMTQAIALSEMLRRNGHEVVEVLVGKSKTREIPEFFYRRIGAKCRVYDTPSFIFKKNQKHIHPLKTLIYNINPKRLKKYKKSIEMIDRRIKKTTPDVVVNFYEILAGLSHLRFSIEVPFINIGHQFLIKHPDYMHAKGDGQGMMLFRLHTLLCGIGATKTLALSFYPLKDNIPQRIAVVPPLLRKEVLELTPGSGDYILGYMLNQGYENEVREWHRDNPDAELNFFWDKKGVESEVVLGKGLTMHQLDDKKFLQYMAGCKGYITTAGFESICEAVYLNKPVMMIPVHIEQEVNAADAESAGCGITGTSFNISRLNQYIESYKGDNNRQFRDWVDCGEELFLKHLTTLV
ncbi:glycosyltransferase family protein [Dysgonomonas sp.]